MAQHEYVLRIKDLPRDQKPREKLLTVGVTGLSLADLLAILWGSGTTKEGVLEMAGRMWKEVEGWRMEEYKKNPQELVQKYDLPLNKVLQLLACMELGKRMYKRGDGQKKVIKTPSDVFEYAEDIRTHPNEHLKVLYLNGDYEVIYEETVSIGTVDTSRVHARDVFGPALEKGALGIVLVHNHPSGNAEPSKADRDVTAMLIKSGKIMGINIVDHVIVTKDHFKSIPSNYGD